MEALKDKMGGLDYWYKLYADDLVFICNRRVLGRLIRTFKKITNRYGLILNPKKSGIFLLKKRRYLLDEIEGIPLTKEYRYLGVWIDNFGRLTKQLDYLEMRSNYLYSSTNYYIRDLSFENQYLLWQVFVRPYFLYVAPIINTQLKGNKDRFHKLWRKSFKQFLKFPFNLGSNVLDFLFENSFRTTNIMHKNNIENIRNRQGLEEIEEQIRDINEFNDIQKQTLLFRFVPNNFQRIFYYQQYKCKCCQRNLTLEVILRHYDPEMSTEDFLRDRMLVWKLKQGEEEDENIFKELKIITKEMTMEKRSENRQLINNLLETIDRIIDREEKQKKIQLSDVSEETDPEVSQEEIAVQNLDISNPIINELRDSIEIDDEEWMEIQELINLVEN